MKKLNIIAGMDIGNGYVKTKMKIEDQIFVSDVPSTVSYTASENLPKQVTKSYMDDFENELDATVVSNGIKQMDAGRVLFGKRGIRSGESSVEFNIENHTPKCLESLSIMLVMGILGANAQKYLYQTNQTVEDVELDVNLGIALPIEDYLEYRKTYENILKNETHELIINNFANRVYVKINFSSVTVLAEGVAAQYAVEHLGAKFLQLALDEAKGRGFEIDDAYTGEMLSNAKNTIGVDIGEGTVNFPVFVNGDVSIESSSSINKGYGTVLTSVVGLLRNTKYAFDSRKDLADFMLQKNPMPSQKFVMNKVQQQINNQVKIFAREVVKEYSKIFRKVGLRTDVIYVYGGGANGVINPLYEMLMEASKLDSGQSVPVIYLDSEYSRDLNRNGLFEVASLVADI